MLIFCIFDYFTFFRSVEFTQLKENYVIGEKKGKNSLSSMEMIFVVLFFSLFSFHNWMWIILDGYDLIVPEWQQSVQCTHFFFLFVQITHNSWCCFTFFVIHTLVLSLSVSFICNHCHRFSFAARKSFCIVTTKGDHLYLDAIQKISIFVYMTWTTANGKIFSVHWICYVVPHSHTSSNGERITKQIAARREKNTHSKFISRLRTHN